MAIVDNNYLTGIPEDAYNLKNMLDGIVERVENVFQTYSVSLPNRRYWTFGEPVIDCEQLVVSFIQMYLGTPGDEATTPQRCHMPRSAVVTISIARQIPVVGANGRPPSPEKIQESSSASAVDAWVLMEAVKEFDMWDGTGFGLGVIATVDVLPAEGGFQAVNMQLTLAVP
jgi:hypothetical protein